MCGQRFCHLMLSPDNRLLTNLQRAEETILCRPQRGVSIEGQLCLNSTPGKKAPLNPLPNQRQYMICLLHHGRMKAGQINSGI